MSRISKSVDLKDSMFFVLNYIEDNCNNNDTEEKAFNNITKILDILKNLTLTDEEYDILVTNSTNLKVIFYTMNTNSFNNGNILDNEKQVIYYKLLKKYLDNINNNDVLNNEIINNSHYDTYELYNRDIRARNDEILSLEEEIELGKRIRQNDKVALDELILKNLRLVISIANSFRQSNVDFMDLIQIGNEALIRAAKTFDYSKNIRFSTYATNCIRNQLCRDMVASQVSGYNISGYMKKRMNNFLQIYNSFDLDFQGDRFKETIKKLNISENEGNIILNISKGIESLNKKMLEDESNELINLVSDQKNFVEDIENSMLVDEILNVSYLTDREKNILRYHYGIGIKKPLELEEISKIMNIKSANISRIEKRALRKIRVRNRDKQHLKK